MPKEFQDDGYCFACGERNDLGLKIRFEKTDEGARAAFSVDKRFQGYKDIVHGGIIGTVLDEASVKAVMFSGVKAVTAELTLRLKQALFVDENAIVETKIEKNKGKLFEVRGEIRKTDGELIAHSRAKLFIYGE